MEEADKRKGFVLQDGSLYQEGEVESDKVICIFPLEQLEKAAQILGESKEALEKCLRGNVSVYECHERFDYLSLSMLDMGDPLRKTTQLCVYFHKNALVVLTDDCACFYQILHDFYREKIHCEEPVHVFCLFLERLTEFDYQVLEEMEEEISTLEEAVFETQKEDAIRDMMALRKRLMALRRYYERLLFVCDEAEENENELLGRHTIRAFHALTMRVGRLQEGVRGLQDYVTQVRDAYQAQVGIKLNQLMKVFTVITSIFLPLTLIVGWYGMNIAMPEFGWKYAYPFVVTFSIAVVLLFVAFFKKKKWF